MADAGMQGWQQWLADNNELIRQDIERLAAAEAVLLRDAQPPEKPGVYMFLVDGEIKYVGYTQGSGGLNVRIMSKHLAGSESHTLQRAFKEPFPDRQERRNFLKNHISAKWVAIDDAGRAQTVERQLLQMLQPPWNFA